MKAALLETGLFIIYLACHWTLDFALGLVFPEYKEALHLVRLVVFGVFAIGYVNQAIEVLFILAPWSRGILTVLGERAGLKAGRWLRRPSQVTDQAPAVVAPAAQSVQSGAEGEPR